MAIIFDAGSTGNTTGTSLTVSHTCSGSNRLLLVLTMHGGGTTQVVTGVTYNGAAMTKVSDFFETSSASTSAWWYLVAPTTGANNIVASLSASRSVKLIGVSYTGASQTGQPDAHTERSDIAAATSSTTNTTTIADNCWVIIGGRTATGDIITAGTNVTKRQGASSDFMIAGDNNAAITPAGVISQTLNYAASTASEVGTFSIAPAVAETFIPKIIMS